MTTGRPAVCPLCKDKAHTLHVFSSAYKPEIPYVIMLRIVRVIDFSYQQLTSIHLLPLYPSCLWARGGVNPRQLPGS